MVPALLVPLRSFETFQEMDHNQISQYLQRHRSDWITWITNPPTASHMGRVWERQIRTARSILNTLLKTHGRSLNDEALHTLLIEVEAIVKSRPMTAEQSTTFKFMYHFLLPIS